MIIPPGYQCPFKKNMKLGARRVAFPYERSTLSATFVPGNGEGKRPRMIFCNGVATPSQNGNP
jgi:hypothetical protein